MNGKVQFKYSNGTKFTEYASGSRAFVDLKSSVAAGAQFQVRSYTFANHNTQSAPLNFNAGNVIGGTADGGNIVSVDAAGTYRVWLDYSNYTLGFETIALKEDMRFDSTDSEHLDKTLERQKTSPKKASISSGSSYAGQYIYLWLGNIYNNNEAWNGGGARIYAYIWDGSHNAQKELNYLSGSDGDSIWRTSLANLDFAPTGIKFIRSSGSGWSSSNWNDVNKWCETGNIEFSYGLNQYKLNGWNSATQDTLLNESSHYQVSTTFYYRKNNNDTEISAGQSYNVTFSESDEFKVYKYVQKRLFAFGDPYYSDIDTWFNPLNHVNSSPSTGLITIQTDGNKNIVADRAFTANFTFSYTDDSSFTYSFVEKTNVTLDNQSATTAGESSVVAVYGDAMPSIAGNLPAKDGYTFGGYWTGENGTGTQYYKEDGTSNNNWELTGVTSTLYAEWTAITSEITFNNNGEGIVPGKTAIVTYDSTYGDAVDSSSNPFWPTANNVEAAEGRKFVGWFTSGGAEVKSTDTVKITDDTTLFAHWEDVLTYALTYAYYFVDTGTSSGSVSMGNRYEGQVITLSAYSPEYDNYRFVGFYDSSDCSINYLETTYKMASSAHVLYAKMERLYTLTYEYRLHGPSPSNTGSVSLGTFINGESYTLSSAGTPTYSGYTFEGWYTNNTCTTPAGGSVTMGAANKTIYAKMIKTYTVFYKDPQNGNVDVDSAYTTYVWGDGLTLPASASKTNFTFGGWYTSNALSGNAVTTLSSSDSGNKTFYAKWTRSVEIDKNATLARDGTATHVTVTFGQPLPTLTAEQLPSRNNYTLNGLYSSSSGGTQYLDGNGTPTNNVWTSIENNAKVYAQWSYSSTYYLIGDATFSGGSALAWTVEGGQAMGSGTGTDKASIGPLTLAAGVETKVYCTLSSDITDAYNNHYLKTALGADASDYVNWANDKSNFSIKTGCGGYFTIAVNSSYVAYIVAPTVTISGQGKFIRGTTVDSGLVNISLSTSKIRYGENYTPEAFGDGYYYNGVTYTKTGWYSNTSLTKTLTSLTNVTSNQTIYAKFEDLNDYAVTVYQYNIQTGSAVVIASTTLKYDQDYILTASPSVDATKAGWTTGTFIFKNWRSGSGTGTVINNLTQTMKGSPFAFYATYNPGYRISFNVSNDPNATVTPTYYDGEANTTIGTNMPTPTFSDATKVFKGWYTAPSGGTQISSSYNITADATIYAQWVSLSSVFNGGEDYYALIENSNWNDSSPVYVAKLTNGTYNASGEYYPDTYINFTHIQGTALDYVELTSGHWQNLEILRCASPGWNGNSLATTYNQSGTMTRTNFGDTNAIAFNHATSFAFGDNAFRSFYKYNEGDWIYLKPNSYWKTTVTSTSDASVQLTPRYAIYLFGQAQTVWIELEGVVGGGDSIEYYRAKLVGLDNSDAHEAWIGGIFVRLNPNVNTLSWADGVKYNQSPDLYRYQSDDTLCYVMNEGNNWTDDGSWTILTHRAASQWYLIGESSNSSSSLYGINWHLDATKDNAGQAIQMAAGTNGNLAQCPSASDATLHLFNGDKLKVVYVNDIIPEWTGYQVVKNGGCVNISGFAAKANGSSTDIVIGAECYVKIFVNSDGKIWIMVASYPDQATGVGYSGAKDSTDSAGNIAKANFPITVNIDNSGSDPVIASVSTSVSAPTHFVFDHFAYASTKTGSLITNYPNLYAGKPSDIYGIFRRETTTLTVEAIYDSSTTFPVETVTVDKGDTLNNYTIITMPAANVYNLIYASDEEGAMYAFRPTATTLYESYTMSGETINWGSSINVASYSITTATTVYVETTKKTSKTFYLDTSGSSWTAIHIMSTDGWTEYFNSYVENGRRDYQVAPYLFKITMPENYEFRVTNGVDPIAAKDNWDGNFGGLDNWSSIVNSNGGTFAYIHHSVSASHSVSWCSVVSSAATGTATITINGTKYQMGVGDWTENYFVYELGIEVHEGYEVSIDVNNTGTALDSMSFNGSTYQNGGGLPSGILTTSVTNTIVVKVTDNVNWVGHTVYAYAYNSSSDHNAAWPGVKMEQSLDDEATYYLTFNKSYSKIIFNTGAGGKQTQGGDPIDFVLGATYTVADQAEDNQQYNVTKTDPSGKIFASADNRLNFYIYFDSQQSRFAWSVAQVPLLGNGFYISTTANGYNDVVKMTTYSSTEASYTRFYASAGQTYYFRSYIDARELSYTTFNLTGLSSYISKSGNGLLIAEGGSGYYNFTVLNGTVYVTVYEEGEFWKLNPLDVISGTSVQGQDTALLLEIEFTVKNVGEMEITATMTNTFGGHVGASLYLSENKIASAYVTLTENSNFYATLNDADDAESNSYHIHSGRLVNMNSDFVCLPAGSNAAHTYYAYILIDYVDLDMSAADARGYISFVLNATQITA